jgi:hypothetical protein
MFLFLSSVAAGYAQMTATLRAVGAQMPAVLREVGGIPNDPNIQYCQEAH